MVWADGCLLNASARLALDCFWFLCEVVEIRGRRVGLEAGRWPAGKGCRLVVERGSASFVGM